MDFLLNKVRKTNRNRIYFTVNISALPGISMRAKYGIFNDQGEQLFFAFEGI